MENLIEHSLWDKLDNIVDSLKTKRLADVFRTISFKSFETYGPHEHERIEINFVSKGSCMLHLGNNETVTFRENEIMIIHSNLEHMFEAGPKGVTLLQLEFLPDIFEKFNPLENKSDNTELELYSIFSSDNRLIKIVNNIRIMRSVKRIINEMKDKKKFYQHLVVMYYAELLILLYRHMTDTYLPLCTNEYLKDAVGIIHQKYDTDISICEISQEIGVGERYLRKLFSINLNISPLEYLNQVRINKAIELLKHTEMSIKEVAFSTGFNSSQYFSRVFKSQTGMAPSELTR